MKSRTKKMIVFGGLFVLFLLVINVPIPMNITAPAIEISLDDPSHIEERTVEISGRWHINIFPIRRLAWPRHEFRGRIEILEYPETRGEVYPVTMYTFRGALLRHVGQIRYPEAEQGRYWGIYTRFLPRRIVIEVLDWGEREDGTVFPLPGTTRYIVLNAATREEAMDLLGTRFP